MQDQNNGSKSKSNKQNDLDWPPGDAFMAVVS